ncbi:Glycerate dehydrogenase [Caprobacter fermentans]|uniref:Glycerate dehydrogenase n=1 Tax=Caproicibacter fermentans TaxID=2576756 RepID=A0A6N8I4H3_9FIRM|nr:C-terminal binding protein [Caproicibacter fermentans]MVB12942.1 Glycerate dehydrogenase [Caproicibacter fermentans]OCN02517.1 dehydrogenase [Clostridium sp. W14A]
MENPKIIICDCDHKDVETERDVFKKSGFDFKWLHCKTEQEVIDQCQGAVCFLNQYAPMNETVFKAIPTLKMIVRYGVGVDNVDVPIATKYGVQVCNVPDYGTNEVADQALALMLSLVRKIHMIGNMTRKGIWDYQEAIPVKRLACSTVGIIGTGRIGVAFAKRVHTLGCKVIAYDVKYGQDGYSFPDFIGYKSMDEVLAQADILSLHCALTEQSKEMMNDAAFAKMKEGSYFINVARGGLVDEQALVQALSSGKLAGAGLDVVAHEPLSKGSPIFEFSNVVVTPHMGWYSKESAEELNRKCAEETVRFMNDEPVHYPINHI